jgi:hypothetical protein
MNAKAPSEYNTSAFERIATRPFLFVKLSLRASHARAGYRHFLVRGFNKVRGEWSLMALCYNFTRVLNILGLERFVAAIAETYRFSLLSPMPKGLSAL